MFNVYVCTVELKRLAGPGIEVSQHIPSLQQRLRSKLAGLKGSSYSPVLGRRSPRMSPRPVVQLVSAPTHISTTSHIDATTLGLSLKSSPKRDDATTADERDGGAATVDKSFDVSIQAASASFPNIIIDGHTFFWEIDFPPVYRNASIKRSE